MKEHPLPRWPRFMVLNWAFVLPFLSVLHAPRRRRCRRARTTPPALLEQDDLVMVFPEGVKGTGKPFSERYRLQRFGRGGFVEVALRARLADRPGGRRRLRGDLPDDRPTAARSRRLTGAPFAPITPTFPWLGPLGLIPLPSKWRIEFCAPIDLSEYPPEAAEDRRLVFDLSEQVRETIQAEALREPGQARLGVSVGRRRRTAAGWGGRARLGNNPAWTPHSGAYAGSPLSLIALLVSSPLSES